MTSKQNKPATATKAKADPIVLPTIEVSESDTPITQERTSYVNPFDEHVKVANDNRAKSYQVAGITDARQAQKVTHLLQKAGRAAGCSMRSQWDQDANVVRFQAKDLITRTRKPVEA